MQMDPSTWMLSTVPIAVMKSRTNIKQKQMNNVLVTGGCGFIGSHLVDAIVNFHPQTKVVVVDDLRTPGNHKNGSSNVTYIHESIQNPEIVEALKQNIVLIIYFI